MPSTRHGKTAQQNKENWLQKDSLCDIRYLSRCDQVVKTFQMFLLFDRGSCPSIGEGHGTLLLSLPNVHSLPLNALLERSISDINFEVLLNVTVGHSARSPHAHEGTKIQLNF